MFEVAELIFTILSTDSGVNTIVGNKIFPLVADQKTKTPFIVYELEELPRYSKGSANEYIITIHGFEDNFNKTIVLSEAIKTALAGAAQIFKYEGSQTHYQSEKELIIKQRYKYKN